jgi:hypothetical protein
VREFGKTDIMDQLLKLRNAKINDVINQNDDRVQPLDHGAGSGVSRWHARKRIHEVSDVIAIEAPTIGDVAGISLKVMGSYKKNTPLFMQLNEENLQYIKDTCAEQIADGTKRRVRTASSTIERKRFNKN